MGCFRYKDICGLYVYCATCTGCHNAQGEPLAGLMRGSIEVADGKLLKLEHLRTAKAKAVPVFEALF